jgi:hypothetical protein
VAILIDLGVVLALLAGLIAAVISGYIRRSRVTVTDSGYGPPVVSRAASARVPVRWAWALGLALAVLMGFNVAVIRYGQPQGLATVLVAGTWKAGGSGLDSTIRFSSDGTFTATSLPRDADAPAGGERPPSGG